MLRPKLTVQAIKKAPLSGAFFLSAFGHFSRASNHQFMDIKSLSDADLKKLLRALANLPDAELAFLGRRIQQATRRHAASYEGDGNER